jgi:hypothetical protein
VLGFVEAYRADEVDGSPGSFAEVDLRRANRGGARISAAQIGTILERRAAIEGALAGIPFGASLTGVVPWSPLGELFGAFAGIGGVGVAKTTKSLHPKRPALIPLLDSVVVAYLTADDKATGTFAEQALELVRRYKGDLDRNRLSLAEARAALADGGHALTEVRILDIVIWSQFATG